MKTDLPYPGLPNQICKASLPKIIYLDGIPRIFSKNKVFIRIAVFVKLVVAIPNKFHCSYDALLSLGFDSSFERSGLSQTLSGNSQSLVEPVQRSGCLAFANS